MEYDEARSIMATHKANILKANGKGKVGSLAPDRKFLKFRTFLFRKESPADDIAETYEIHYFQTAIITLYSDKVKINDGGFFSHSTHERLNEYMPRGFRVHGSKPHWYHSPVGFIRTPLGTSPYNLPQSFMYDGQPADTDLSIEAGLCFHLIPAYVEKLLTLAFEGDPDLRVLNDIPVTDDRHSLGDHQWPVEVLKKQLYRPILLRHVSVSEDFKVTKAFRDEQFGGHALEYIVEVLLQEGADVLKSTRTKAALVRHVEATLRLGGQIPTVNLRTLKKYLREVLIDFLVAELGFINKEWNRRDAT